MRAHVSCPTHLTKEWQSQAVQTRALRGSAVYQATERETGLFPVCLLAREL